jgi:hypothetical protein
MRAYEAGVNKHGEPVYDVYVSPMQEAMLEKERPSIWIRLLAGVQLGWRWLWC